MTSDIMAAFDHFGEKNDQPYPKAISRTKDRKI